MFNWLKRWRAKPAPAVPLRIPEVVIDRGPSGPEGTFGSLTGPGGFSCKVCELPDRGNAPNFSRIPAGTYQCLPYKSPRFGRAYLVSQVEGRSYILTHAGNLAGDTKRGYRSHSLGCILLGKYFGRLGGQRAVMCSRPVIRSFCNLMAGQPFTLEIREAQHGS